MTNKIQIYNQLKTLLDSHNEWLLVHHLGKTFALQNNELELEETKNKTLFSFLDEKGFQTWRVVEAEIKDEKIALDLSKNFGKEKTFIELIPRAKAEMLGESVELARLEKANQIANLIVSEIENTKLIRVELNKENGRSAQIILENKLGKQTAVLSDVSDSLTPEILLSSAILWLTNLQRRKKNPIDEIWILSEKRIFRNLQKLHACLKDNFKNNIKLKEISRKDAKGQRKNKESKIVEAKVLRINDLWHYKPKQLHFVKDLELSEISREIIKLSPDRLDYLFSKNGETLRYLGLPFVRVRKAFDEEKAWFGIDKSRRILDKNSYEDFYELFENIKKHRRFDAENKQHAFYQTSPEAWLESILRENIKLLDANLILSPIYNQFRTSRDKIDLALRKDGRLVIIELKVSPDREMIFQAVDYWRKIELQRRT
ncbi:MAG: hypothetical protein M3405_04395 [Acidobacteriota bacterium]|jgi:hypothetical protein|nr:hypothetical protein [Acidobacteriota bacterium]